MKIIKWMTWFRMNPNDDLHMFKPGTPRVYGTGQLDRLNFMLVNHVNGVPYYA